MEVHTGDIYLNFTEDHWVFLRSSMSCIMIGCTGFCCSRCHALFQSFQTVKEYEQDDEVSNSSPSEWVNYIRIVDSLKDQAFRPGITKISV